MLSSRVLIAGEGAVLAREIRAPLELHGYSVRTSSALPAPALTLVRHCPDILVLELGRDALRSTAWRRAIESYRMRRTLNVLVVLTEEVNDEELRLLEQTADLGVEARPLQGRDLLRSLRAIEGGDARVLRAG